MKELNQTNCICQKQVNKGNTTLVLFLNILSSNQELGYSFLNLFLIQPSGLINDYIPVVCQSNQMWIQMTAALSILEENKLKGCTNRIMVNLS